MFLTAVKNIVFDAGGVIAGFEGDTILACFGSPLDKSGSPVEKAMNFVSELLKDEKLPLRFGIDAGECNFSWSSSAGFSVNGRPAVRARVLASKTVRLKARALITDFVREKINLDAKKIDSLFDDSESVFEFSVSGN
jgi:class 3 adenylate cyclase